MGQWSHYRSSEADDFRRACRESDRLTGACIAMSRFMAFVWMEAVFMANPGWFRAECLGEALNSGLFRLEFAR